MNKQFTASEVREYAKYDDSPEREMLNAFADLLEAREKAVPVAWVNPDDLANPVFAGVNVAKATHPDLGRHYTQPLYTHPAPADAERLAEALRGKIKEWRGAYHHITEWDRGRRHGLLDASDYLERLLSAQAQPQTDNELPGMWSHSDFVGGDPDERSYAERTTQPPAASVTDDYREIARLIGSIFFAGGFKAETRNEEALEFLLRKTGNWFESWDDIPESLLPAQENPNE